MKKRILSAVLALGLLLTTPALATQDGTFSRIRAYAGPRRGHGVGDIGVQGVGAVEAVLRLADDDGRVRGARDEAGTGEPSERHGEHRADENEVGAPAALCGVDV